MVRARSAARPRRSDRLLLFWQILDLDPRPRPQPPPLRLVEAFLPLPFHAFFGVTVTGMNTLLVRTLVRPPRMWHLSPAADQQLGGGLAWRSTELPNLAEVVRDRSDEADLMVYHAWRSSMRQ